MAFSNRSGADFPLRSTILMVGMLTAVDIRVFLTHPVASRLVFCRVI
jgi:hypothetical protein